MLNKAALIFLVSLAMTPGTAEAQGLFSQFEGKTMIFRGKGVSSGKTFTVRGQVAPCSESESGLCLGDFPISRADYAVVFSNDQVQERIQLSAADGKLAAQMNYVNAQGGVEGVVPLSVKVRK